jgi:hypothetical protein
LISLILSDTDGVQESLMEWPEIIKADPGKLLCKKFTWGLHDRFYYYLSLGDNAMARQKAYRGLMSELVDTQ